MIGQCITSHLTILKSTLNWLLSGATNETGRKKRIVLRSLAKLCRFSEKIAFARKDAKGKKYIFQCFCKPIKSFFGEGKRFASERKGIEI